MDHFYKQCIRKQELIRNQTLEFIIQIIQSSEKLSLNIHFVTLKEN